MATTTTKLGLIKPDLIDNVDIGEINDNMDDLDAAAGASIVTFATRPASPWTGQVIYETDTENSFVWSGAAWFSLGGGGSIEISASAPASPDSGDMWWNSTDGNLYIYYTDVDSSQWVAANGPQVFVGTVAPAGYQGQLWFNSATGKVYVYYVDADSSQWVSAVGGLDIARADLPVGSVLQVVSTTKTDTFSTSSTSYGNVTGLTVSITPSSTSSKILVTAFTPIASSGGSTADVPFVSLFRGATNLIQPTSPGSRSVGTSAITSYGGSDMAGFSIQILDSPATTSSITYAVGMRTNGDPGYLNRSTADTNASTHPRGVATITVMEVAG